MFLYNCLLCNSVLGDASEGHISYFFCSKDSDHFIYNMTSGVIQTSHDYGKFQFFMKDNKIDCAIFQIADSGERILWLTDNGINPTVNDIKTIIEKFEIRRLFE